MKQLFILILLMAFCMAGRAQNALYNIYIHNDSSTTFISKIHNTFSLNPYIVKQLQAPIPGNFYTKNFGFFCKEELKMHQANVPVSFRLGSMEYCDMLEQKGCGAH